MAPIDLLNGLNKGFVAGLPTELVPNAVKEHALNIEFHWVTETGKTALLTSGININATVRIPPGSNRRTKI